jgi:hypothetical protein
LFGGLHGPKSTCSPPADHLQKWPLCEKAALLFLRRDGHLVTHSGRSHHLLDSGIAAILERMTIEQRDLARLIETELEHVSDGRVIEGIRKYLIEPKPVMRNWDYGEPNQQYLCWIVFAHGDNGIAYCEQGFGPKAPWGLVSVQGSGERNSMGMDSGWFKTFLDAYFDSAAATHLPIWRVFHVLSHGERRAVTDELSWDDAWNVATKLRNGEPSARFDVGQSILGE